MHFQNHEMLWCLFALLIPIVVHLFNMRRYKLTYFSNTEVLKQIEQQTAKTQKLKHRIVLALRCLFIIVLVLAFAKPKKDNASGLAASQGSVLTAIYIDNTISMNAMAQKTTLLADAREVAESIVKKTGHSGRFVLLTNNFELQNEYPMNMDEVVGHINEMQTVGAPTALATVLSRIEMIAQQNGYESSMVFLLSDFQENMLNLDGFKPKSIKNIVALPLQSDKSSNIYFDSLWLDSPIVQKHLSNTLHIMVKNDSGSDVIALPISFYVDNETVATASADIQSFGETEVTMQFVVEESGTHRCRVELIDYPIVFDNEYNFVLDSKSGMRVVEISPAPSRVEDVFADDEQFEYTFVDDSHLDYNALRNAQTIVLNTSSEITSTLRQTLIDGLNAGKSLVVFPPEKSSNIDELLAVCGPCITGHDTASIAVGSLSKSNPFFADVLLEVPQYADLPKVKKYCAIRPDAQSEVLMTMQNSLPFLVSRQIGKGNLYLFAVSADTESSNLTNNSLFVPLLVKMALNGGAVKNIANTIGRENMVKLESVPNNGGLLRLSNIDKSLETVVNPVERNGQMYAPIGDVICEPGFYDIVVDGELVSSTAWNASRSESVMKFATTEQINEMLGKSGVANYVVGKNVGDADSVVDGLAHGGNCWLWLLVTALFALVAEVTVLRFWK